MTGADESAFRMDTTEMRVFVTGAAGHQVTSLARSDASAKKLTDAGAKALRGDIEDLGVLRTGATAADGVIHTAFYYQISHLPLGTRLGVFLGRLPTGILNRFMKAALEADRRALETMGGVFQGTDRTLVGTFGTIAMQTGIKAIEDQPYAPNRQGRSVAVRRRRCLNWPPRVCVPPSCVCRPFCTVRTTAMASCRY